MGRILSCHGKKTTGKDNNKTHPNHIDTIFPAKIDTDVVGILKNLYPETILLSLTNEKFYTFATYKVKKKELYLSHGF